MLTAVQVRVLKKNPPKGKEVLDSDEFAFDKDFSHPLHKVKINQIQIKETVEENKRTNDQVHLWVISDACCEKGQRLCGLRLVHESLSPSLAWGLLSGDRTGSARGSPTRGQSAKDLESSTLIRSA